MRTVNMETIVAMRNELSTFKMSLVKALETGSAMPTVNAQQILNKFIVKATSELKLYMPTVQAKRVAKNTLTVNMEDVLKG